MNTGINPDPAAQLKRGVLKIDGRQLYYVSARAPLNTDPAILTTVLFDCPGDALMLGSWGQLDPAPQKPKEELDLEGTVADEAELARFLKQFNPPCR